jgi:hypothetical protein
MDKQFNKAKERYHQIEMPEELDSVVQQSITQAKKELAQENHYKFYKKIKIGIAATLLVALSFSIGVNTSQSFANQMNDIPVIAHLVNLVSFRNFELDNNLVKAEINIPSIQGIEDQQLQEQINNEIHQKMLDQLEDSRKRAKENKEAFIATGGKAEDFRPLIVQIDYELKYQSYNLISFSVFHFESQASSFQETYYYTIDLKNNEILSLRDLLGEDYEQQINNQIKKQIAERSKDENQIFFEGDQGFQGITENQSFYVNDATNVVIVFDKYSIAPGYMGEVEFEIH